MVAVLALRNPQKTGTAAGSDTRAASALPTPTVSPSQLTPSAVASSSTTASPTGSSGSSGATDPLVGALPLVVLNDTYTPNLARDAAHRFEQSGWTVTSYDENYSNDIISTVAYYDPAVARAHRVALALQRQFPTIKRVVPKFAGLPDGPIVVVLTTDYTPA